MTSAFQRSIRSGAALLTLGLLLLPPSWAKWARPTDMPVARLLKNVKEYIKAHPTDPNGFYTLGRINSAAFAQDRDRLGVYPALPLPVLPSQDGLNPAVRNRARPVSAHALSYLADAVANYRKATALNSRDGLSWLGLGFQCEEALPFPLAVVKAGKEIKAKPGAESLRQEALRFYRKAYSLTVKSDPDGVSRMESSVSTEAAEGVLRLQAGRRLSADEQNELAQMKEQIAAAGRRPRFVTPILISFQSGARLSELLAPERSVRFDLAGDGLGRSWPWVKPTTGILVWDPRHTGKITSGLQLFGSVTWWLFWKDGYAPLAALDNDHNGWLEGAELKGIAVWLDRNGNGMSDPGEVVSLASLGIRRIATQAAGSSDGAPANPSGVELQDGSHLATFDWNPVSLPAPARKLTSGEAVR